jgi:hypothetical protein
MACLGNAGPAITLDGGYGLGKVVESWYSTGIPSTTPK